MNVFISDTRLSGFHMERGLLPSSNRLDIFKYSLASLASLCWWDKVIINAFLDGVYYARREELATWIYTLFPKTAVYRTERLGYQQEWQKDLLQEGVLETDFIMFLCNDDHIFLDASTAHLEKAVTVMKGDSYPYRSLYISHYPELRRIARNSNQQEREGLICFDWQNIDSVQIVSKELLRAIWFDYDYGSDFMPRSDYYRQAESPLTHFYLTPIEQFRHFDGYGHVQIDINECPPLAIPPGFFQNDIKIRYGYMDNLVDWVNINLDKKNYTTVDAGGTDYKYSLEKLPLFWQQRLSTIDCNPDYDRSSDELKYQAGCLQIASSYMKG